VYDAVTNKKLYAFSGTFSATWLPDSIRFVGMDDYLFIQDTKTGQRENLLKISEYVGKFPKDPLRLFVLQDGQRVCLYYYNGVDNLLSVDLKTGKQWNHTLKAAYRFDETEINSYQRIAGWQKNSLYHEVIYKESNQFIDKLIWTKDSTMLYCFQQNTDGTNIYRIMFKPS
jgi:hypothetical protein